MKMKKEYQFSRKRQIWRILPTDTGKLVIEERDIQKREAYFNCIELKSGKIILENFQLDEKFWVGIEAVYGDLIFFHKYRKPDMPAHKGIISVDINSGLILWQNPDYNFLFILGGLLYCYKLLFDGKMFYALDYLTGESAQELGTDSSKLNVVKENDKKESKEDDYIFPESTAESREALTMGIYEGGSCLSGNIQTAKYGNLIFIHALERTGENTRNIFKAIDSISRRTIFSEILNKETGRFIPDSFFIKGSQLFLLKEKDTLVVYSLK